ncbi:MAG: LON peptidase substrate-binding domain-containing protein [Chloroflexota bacterium]
MTESKKPQSKKRQAAETSATKTPRKKPVTTKEPVKASKPKPSRTKSAAVKATETAKPRARKPKETTTKKMSQKKPATNPATDNATGEPSILTLPVLPLRGTVVFPLTVVPLAAAQARSLRLIDEVMTGDRTVALVMQKDPEIEGASPDQCHTIGTIARIHQMKRVPDGSVRIDVQCSERMRLFKWVTE